MDLNDKIVIYCTADGQTTVDVRMNGERVDGVKQSVAFYSLDVIISVGYRVKSQRGTQFRIWANKVLKEYLVKGYAVNKALTEQHYTELKQLVAVLGRK